MNLNLSGWEPKNVKVGSKGLVYKIFDHNAKKYRWLTLSEIKINSREVGILDTKSYLTFIEEAEKMEMAWRGSSGDFEKIILNKWYTHGEKVYVDAEIIETHYDTPIGEMVSTPKLVKRISTYDFNAKNEAWGIDEEILIVSKKTGVEEIQLVDDYNGVYFYTTLHKYDVVGETTNWGKIYLPLKHFTVKKFGDRTPFYARYLRNVKQ